MAKLYFITSAVPGAALNRPFYNSILNFCKRNKAELLVIPTIPINKKDTLDTDIPEDRLVLKEKFLNSKIRISDIPVNPQSVDPVTGLGRHSQTDGSFIFASPKQRLKLVPNSNTTLPHALMTPGAVTVASSYRNNRQGRIAEMDHIDGGLIVEVVDKSEYHYTQVQADTDGSFIDLGTHYFPNGKTQRAEADAIVWGDLHDEEKYMPAYLCGFDLIKRFNPNSLILHDIFNGNSTRHHSKKLAITNALISQKNGLSIENEVKNLSNTLADICKKAKKVVIARSNHDEWLDQYLEEVDYKEDPLNHRFALKLANAKVDGENPLEFGVKQFNKLKNLKFLARGEDYKLTKKEIQCGAHGDKGNNGARGSAVAMELSHAQAIFGHTHTPEILRGAWVVGTTSILNPIYTRGSASSWLNTHCILWKNGSRQLVNVINGRYTTVR